MTSKTENPGQFQKGKSGNPGGRPKDVNEIKKLALEKCPRALEVLYEIMDDAKSDKRARVAAANAIMDRGLGKPTQPIDGDGAGGAILVKILDCVTRDNSTK